MQDLIISAENKKKNFYKIEKILKKFSANLKRIFYKMLFLKDLSL